ncbi:hypothetical protein CAPTEDRAFT_191630 [Capitella teleta]|uniref:IkappaB kinase n=1 Tax=Capitella teleta TaxID=283909 RepID=R7T858_CAPTE|nr:hypothetical protein CAPTEDRAFT_191630 [Capitella teleta]|eukprot:ELT89790.1 hypothetical protein CAPTEDRAFT_191630 [Capitella teleta]
MAANGQNCDNGETPKGQRSLGHRNLNPAEFDNILESDETNTETLFFQNGGACHGDSRLEVGRQFPRDHEDVLSLGYFEQYDRYTADEDDTPRPTPPPFRLTNGNAAHVTDKYMLYEHEFLGRGATSEVHLGRNRNTGEHVAVKVMKEKFAPHTERETKLLKTLKHENIVKLKAVEKFYFYPKDKLSRTWLILEWSKIGSVDTLLSLPQNKFGLCEEDLLAFLNNMARQDNFRQDSFKNKTTNKVVRTQESAEVCTYPSLVDALLFLNQNKVVHGDIKPKNILVYLKDWRHEFKLADFGISQYDAGSMQKTEGTPEYMHPKVLQRQHAVDSATDLWSFAITLLHCCNGKLPFQVKGGRTNLALFTDLILLKPKEAIGGYIGNSGVKKYEFELSTSCRLLSRYLRTQFTSLVQNLLQVDISTIPKIEDVRNEVNLIKERQRVYFFNTRSLDFILCDVPTSAPSNRPTYSQVDSIFLEKVFDELRSNIGTTNDFRVVFLSMNLVQESELSSQLTKWVLQRTTLDNPVLIFATRLTTEEDFALQCESPDVSLFNRESLEADYQLACDCLAFLYVMQNRLKLYRQRVHVTRNVLEKTRDLLLRENALQNGLFRYDDIENIFDEIYSYEIRFGDMPAMECAIEQMKEVHNVMKSDRKQEIIRDEDSLQEHEYTRNQIKEILQKSHEMFTDNVSEFKKLAHKTKRWLKMFYNSWMKNASSEKSVLIESAENHHGNQKVARVKTAHV